MLGGAWLPHGYHLDDHSHPDGQLVYAAAGVLATTTVQGTWVAPANRVTWTPPGFQHSHRFYGDTDARVLTIPADECHGVVARPSVFTVSPLVREALLALTSRRDRSPEAEKRLRAVVIDEIVETPNSRCTCPSRATIDCGSSPTCCVPTLGRTSRWPNWGAPPGPANAP